MSSKYYSNPDRNKTTPFQPYVPQWKQRGIIPLGYEDTDQGKANVPFAAHIVPKTAARDTNYPRTRNVPYAEVVGPMPKIVLPNVGNNIENTWSGIDGEIVDTGEFTTKPMINNDVITVFDGAQLNVGYDELVLIVKGEIISTGPMEQIQEEVRAILFEEHPLSIGNAITTDDIVILKRIKIKVGVFLEQG